MQRLSIRSSSSGLLSLGWIITIVTLVAQPAPPAESLAGAIVLALLTSIAIFLVPGFTGALIIELVAKQKFSALELLNMTLAVSLFLPPAWLLIIHRTTGYLHTNTALLLPFVLSGVLILFQLPHSLRLGRVAAWRGLNYQMKLIGLLRHPFFYAALIYGAIYLGIVLPYWALPDLDPYTWLNLFDKYFSAPTPTALPPRPLFYYFMHLLQSAVPLDLTAIFKYVLPAMSAIILSGAALAATGFSSRLVRFMIYLTPLMAASTIIYAYLPIPQTIVVWVAAWFFFWLLHSHHTKNIFWFYAAGALVIVAFLYHEVAILLFLPWLVVFIPISFRSCMAYLRLHPVNAAIIGILALGNIAWISSPWQFIRRWFHYIFTLNALRPNLQFPARYTNIDGLAMGWPGADGILKYYLYYIGPPLLFMAGATILWLRHETFRAQIRRELKEPALRAIVLALAFFLILTEIAPRLAGINLLPERAWIFGSLVAPILLIFYIWTFPTRHRHVTLLVIMLTFISIGGAAYINWQKRYVIPNYQVASAHWIKQHLPENRVIVAYGHTNLITRHSLSSFIWVPPDFYCSPDLKIFQPTRQLPVETQWRTGATTIIARDTALPGDLASYINEYVSQAKSQPKLEPTPATPSPPTYVYYSPSSPHNPYRDRPYENSGDKSACQTPTLSQHTDDFEEIYNDNGRVIIWKVRP